MAASRGLLFGLIVLGLSWPALSCTAAPSRASYALQAAEILNSQPVRYVIVVTGGELLAGAYPDGHTVFLTRTLRPLGLECVGSITVDDRLEDIQAALRFASTRANLVLVTGGLGPTENDVTREAISEFTGIGLREDPQALADLARRFNVPVDDLRPNLRRQARIPEGGASLQNPGGTAVGLIFETAKPIIVALPGPPREMQAMVRDQLVPYLGRSFGTASPGSSLTIRFVGIGQSSIDQALRDHGLLRPDLTVSSHFEHGRVDFSFSLPPDHPRGPEEFRAVRQGLLDHLGEYIYAEDATTSLEDRVLSLLESRNITLSLAEAGSGGALAAALSGSTGAARSLLGAYVAADLRKLHKLVASPQESWEQTSSVQIALEVARRTGSLWTLVTGEIRKGEEEGTWLPVWLRLPDGRVENREFRLAGTGESARARLVTELLDHLRRKLKQTAE
jgi:nicotinamide-nucleotide amidase